MVHQHQRIHDVLPFSLSERLTFNAAGHSQAMSESQCVCVYECVRAFQIKFRFFCDVTPKSVYDAAHGQRERWAKRWQGTAEEGTENNARFFAPLLSSLVSFSLKQRDTSQGESERTSHTLSLPLLRLKLLLLQQQRMTVNQSGC